MTPHDLAHFDVESSIPVDVTIAAYRAARPARRHSRLWRFLHHHR